MTALPPMQLERHGALDVLSEVLLGGTKERAMLLMLAETPGSRYAQARELVYCSPREGFAQFAIARVCASVGMRCTIFTPAAKHLSPLGRLAQAVGAALVEVPYGYMSVLRARAGHYCSQHPDAAWLPYGLHMPEMVRAIAAIAREQYPHQPTEVWCAAGSGTLAAGLRNAFPNSMVHAVRVGSKCTVPGVVLHDAPEQFQRPAKVKPPFYSCENYDAKVWRFAKDGTGLFWNVAPPLPTC